MYVVLGITAGLFRSAIESADRLRRLPGPLAYLLATVGATVVDDPVEVTLDVEGDRLFGGAARLVAIGGGRYRGRAFELFPDSRPADGALHAVVVEPTGPIEACRLLGVARAGRVTDHPAVHYRSGAEATLESPNSVPVEVDGTPVATPIDTARLSVMRGALRVAYPVGDDWAVGGGRGLKGGLEPVNHKKPLSVSLCVGGTHVDEAGPARHGGPRGVDLGRLRRRVRGAV